MDTWRDEPHRGWPPVPYDAVILAGGRASRLGGLDKPGLLVGGRPLVERVAAAVDQARRLVVVGPPRAPRALPEGGLAGPEGGLAGPEGGLTGPDPLARAVYTREKPPGAGPVPALCAGLAEVTAEWTVVLAADLPFLTATHVSALLRAALPDAPGAVLLDEGGREQWLVGAWRTTRLADASRRYRGRSLRGLLAPLAPVRLSLPPFSDGPAPWFDCDDISDLEDARTRAAASEERR